jgi:hypothetical protein
MSNALQVMEIPTKLTVQHEAWIQMADAKNSLVDELRQSELQAQSLLVVDTSTYQNIDTALATYRKAHSDMVELRKSFTNQIDKGIIQPLMAYEKRVDPKANEVYQRLEKASLALRKEEADRVTRINQVNQELAQFKAHCSNEFFRCAAEYRAAIRREITNQYAYWLKEGTMPDMKLMKDAMSLIDVPSITKFRPVLITKEQMKAVYDEIHKPNYQSILEEMIEEMDATFANFKSDLANKSAALARQKEAQQLADIQQKQQLAEESAINTLIATSEALVIAEPTIKRTYSIVVVESEAWAKNVIAGFISNMPHLAKYIRVKSWSKLSIGQMAEYLAKLATDTDTRVNGLTYESIER